ncbi:sushi domain-containing protein 2-like [Diadema antillarum]|uniref:sushi domain-containing protein 2-like n=1 Tax=Diadema antillarum TaxID=105358 RepID=UPI003A898E63
MASPRDGNSFAVTYTSFPADDILYPYGESVGDSRLPRNDDGGSGEIVLDLEFPYFDQNHEFLIVNTNGIISFLKNVSQYTPDSFPLDDDRRVVAPFWADVDASKETGNVWFRQTTDETELLANLTEQIASIFRVEFRFQPFDAKFAFLATWENVTFYNNRKLLPGEIVPLNTFQAVLVSDGTYSFTIFNYDRIEWTTGSSSFGNRETGLANDNPSAVAAQVGFNAGDGSNYYSVPGSQTDQILNISVSASNVLIPGRWIFRIDGRAIRAGGCGDSTDPDLEISPNQVSMLGGDVLSISGPCFESSSNILCLIEGMRIRAVYDFDRDPFTVRCSTPIFMRVGPVRVELSIDNGQNFNYSGRISVVGLDQIEPAISVERIENDILRMSWATDGFPYQDSESQNVFIDILLYVYEEDETTGTVSITPVSSPIETGIRLANGGVLLEVSAITAAVGGANVGVFRITVSGHANFSSNNRWVNGEVDDASMESPLPAMWSLPFNLNPDSGAVASAWCEEWAADQTHADTTGDTVPPCPCLLMQAMADTSVYEPYPWCERDGGDGVGAENCEYRPEASHCVRARVPSMLGRGQLCCYRPDGHLLHLLDTPAGGHVQVHHHSGFQPDKSPGHIPFFSSFLHDRIPWEECCGKTANDESGNDDDEDDGETSSCDLFRQLRPSDDCKHYDPPNIATVFGEPHVITFDTRNYTFNGYGEYTLVTTTADSDVEGSFTVQGRLEQIMPEVNATGLTAVAIRSAESSTIHVELNERRTMDAWVRPPSPNSTWDAVDFQRSNYWLDIGFTIELSQTTDGRKSFSVNFGDGIAVELEQPPESTAMAVRVHLPPTLKGKVAGLLGTWNDRPSDDFTAPSGRGISGSSPRTLHQFFVEEWNVAESETLFRYEIGSSYSIINQQDFQPVYDLPNFQTEEELDDACGDDHFCRYDYQKTGDPDFGRASAYAHESWKRARDNMQDVISCGYLPPPADGAKEGTVYLSGSLVVMMCDAGYELEGTKTWKCGASGAWIANTTRCVEVEDTRDELILYIVTAVLAFLIILSCLLICTVCIVKRRRKDDKHDDELRSKSNAGIREYQNAAYSSNGDVHAKIGSNGSTPTANGVGNGQVDVVLTVRDVDEADGHRSTGNGHIYDNRNAAQSNESRSRAGRNGTAVYDNGVDGAGGHRGTGNGPIYDNSNAAQSNGSASRAGRNETAVYDNRPAAAPAAIEAGESSLASTANDSSRARPSTSRDDSPRMSRDSFRYSGKAPPVSKTPKKKAKENPYGMLPASFKTKMENSDYETLSKYRKQIPSLMTDHESDESDDEIANIKAQVRREMEKENGQY